MSPAVTHGGLTIRRGADRRLPCIEWTATPGVVGYDVPRGLAASKLYETYQRLADEESSVDLGALPIDQHYFFAMERCEENGVSMIGEAARAE